MLVLSRRRAQQLVIDGTVVVTVISVHGKYVRLGICAPAEVTIRRSAEGDNASAVAAQGSLRHPAEP